MPSAGSRSDSHSAAVLATVPATGCRFHTCCRFAQGVYATMVPQLTEHEPGRHVSCHFAGDLEFAGAMDHRRYA